MTNPYEQPDAAYHQPPQGWGYYPPPAPPRKWYRAPGSLIGAATFSAVSAWLAVAIIAVGWLLLPRVAPDTFEEWLLLIVFGLIVITILFVAGFISFWLAVVGAIATVPLAIAWWRGPDRSPAAMAALSNAVVSWLVLTFLVVHLGVYRALF